MVFANAEIGRIVYTDNSCKINGQPWPGIPTLVWPEGIDEAASDWFRCQVVHHGTGLSSVREYAKILRPFMRYCRSRGKAWQSVDDAFLIEWREHLRRRRKNSIGRVNTCINTIFNFYRWAEETKLIRYRVGIYAPCELPAVLENVTFAISAKRRNSNRGHGYNYSNWTTTLRLNEPSRGSHLRHTPTEEEIRKLHEVTGARVNGDRDSLMFSWAEDTGSRRAEILRICKSDMPTSDQLADMVERDEPWNILVKRKGQKSTPLNASPDLLIRTMDFIQFERRKIVEHCLKAIVGYREPDEVFLSSSTGLVLHEDSLTSIGSQTFGKAGIGNASIHRLRARYAVRTIETLVEAIFNEEMIEPATSWVETLLEKAAAMMGHSSARSLRPYLTYVLNRRIQTSDAMKAEKLSTRLRQLRLHESTLVRRLKMQQDLQSVARYLQVGDEKAAAAAMRVLVDQFG